jgi:hypothetical protein
MWTIGPIWIARKEIGSKANPRKEQAFRWIQDPPRKPGTFLPGHDPRRKRSHRPKGALNKIPDDIRRQCVEGLAAHGYDSKGLDGLPGYVRLLAEKHPKQAARIIEKILPLQINSHRSGATIGEVRIISVPSGQFLSRAEMDLLRDPHMIDHEPELLEAPPEPIEPEPPIEEAQDGLEDLSVEELVMRAHAIVDEG